MPADGILSTADELYETFVAAFPASETRSWLFQEWLTYNKLLRQELGTGFVQWVDGSFVTLKPNPKDIDIVSFIPSAIFRKFEQRLDYYWSDNWEKEGIDAYLVEVINKDESRFNEYIANLTSWQTLYSSTKQQTTINTTSKGFLIVEIE